MKKLYYLIVLTLILGLVLTGCSLLPNVGQVPATDQSGITYLMKHAENAPFESILFAGQNIDVGTMSVWNDEENLYITYDTTGGWEMTETHLAVAGSLPGIPQTKKGNPIPGKFPYQCCYDEDEGEWVFQIKEGGASGATCDEDGNTNTNLTEVEYIIPLSGIGVGGVGADDILYIAAHAKVIRPIEDCWKTVWQIGDVEEIVVASGDPGWTGLSNYADEFNWGDPAGPTTMGLSLVVEKPDFTNPFIVGTTLTDKFPYNSNDSILYNYATDFDVQWNGSLAFGGLLTISWSPGSSASEKKVVSEGGIIPTTFTAGGASKPGEGWFMDKYPLVEHSVAVSPLPSGDHIINFQHTQGDGTFWDWVLLEKPCVQEESAWAGTSVGQLPFDGKNWATYFTYTVQLPQDGMVLWLDAGKDITHGSGVSKWEDQSGNDNDAAQTNSLNQPTYVTNELNGYPVVRFTVSEKYLSHPSILTSDYTAFYVLKLTATSKENKLYYYHAGSVSTGDLGFFAEYWWAPSYGWGSVGNVNNSVTPQTRDLRASKVYPTPLDWRIHTHQPDALYKNGEVILNYVPESDDVYAGGLTTIGSRSDNSTLYFVGDIAEILVYDRILTVSEREMVEDYLSDKYGI